MTRSDDSFDAGINSTIDSCLSIEQKAMVFPVAEDCFGRSIDNDHDLYAKAGKGALHLITVKAAPTQKEQQPNEREGLKSCSVIGVRRSDEIENV